VEGEGRDVDLEGSLKRTVGARIRKRGDLEVGEEIVERAPVVGKRRKVGHD
jgi:hypothetical protein